MYFSIVNKKMWGALHLPLEILNSKLLGGKKKKKKQS
jgi:hypothetical protein